VVFFEKRKIPPNLTHELMMLRMRFYSAHLGCRGPVCSCTEICPSSWLMT